MISLGILLVGLCTIALSRLIFGKWFNHISLYTFVWTGMMALYETKMLNYFPLSSFTYLVVVVSFLSFTIGSLTIIAAQKNSINPPKELNLKFFLDDGKALKQILLIIGLISLLFSIYNWYVLLLKYKSIAGVLLSANEIYKNRVEGVSFDVPYYGFTIYVGIFLSGIYTAYKGRLDIYSIIPLLSAILKGLSSFGRIGMLIMLLEFISTFMLFRHYLINFKVNKINRMKVGIPVLIFLILIIGAASVIKSFRGTFERYKGASPELRSLADNTFFSPSLYLYLSSHVGVLNQYFFHEDDNMKFGQITFSPFYNFSSKFGVVEPVPPDLKGYFIPMWTNSSTYLRNIHSDFGDFGLIVIPYLLGLLTSFFWIRFYSSGNFIHFMLMVHFYLIIGISFFAIVTQGADWYLSIFSLVFIIPFIERKAIRNANSKCQKV